MWNLPKRWLFCWKEVLDLCYIWCCIILLFILKLYFFSLGKMFVGLESVLVLKFKKFSLNKKKNMYPSFFFILLRIRFRNGIKNLTLGAKTLLIITWPLLSIITKKKKTKTKTKFKHVAYHDRQ